MHWWPRQTPSTGSRVPKWRMTSLEMPASRGVQGPGETTMPEGTRAVISSSVIRSLRTTLTSAPSSQRYWYRFQVKLS